MIRPTVSDVAACSLRRFSQQVLELGRLGVIEKAEGDPGGGLLLVRVAQPLGDPGQVRRVGGTEINPSGS